MKRQEADLAAVGRGADTPASFKAFGNSNASGEHECGASFSSSDASPLFPAIAARQIFFFRVLRRLRIGVDFCFLFLFFLSDPEPARRAESLLGEAPKKTKERRGEDRRGFPGAWTTPAAAPPAKGRDLAALDQSAPTCAHLASSRRLLRAAMLTGARRA